MFKLTHLAAVVAIACTLTACGKSEATAANEKEIREIVKQYILDNPEVLVESLTKYQQRSEEEGDKKAEEELSRLEKDIYKNPHSPVIGNPDGKIVIVEFFDYNCGYCKKMVPDVVKLLEENKDVKFILKELPILGPSSERYAKAALVVHDLEPKKYFDFHKAIMEADHRADPNTVIEEVAKSLQIDPIKIAEGVNSKKYQEILDKNVEIARALSITGTPSFIVNGKFLRGAAGYDGLKSAIESTTKK